MQIQEIAIIGAGPAGLALAMQLQRYSIAPLVLEKAQPGGLLRNANLVENYPGFPGGIRGERLVELFRQQACSLEVKITNESVQELNLSGALFRLVTDRDTYFSQRVAICSGTKPREFSEFSIPEDLQGRVFYEVAPLLQETGKQVVIVGAGDAAFDYALNLSRKNQVTVLNRGRDLSCLPLLWQRARAVPQIRYLDQVQIVGIHPSAPGGLQIDCVTRNGELRMQADYLIGAIGRGPQLDFVHPEVAARSPELEAEGRLFFAGDVKNGIFRQTSIAAGEGILAAMKIYQQIHKEQLE